MFIRHSLTILFETLVRTMLLDIKQRPTELGAVHLGQYSPINFKDSSLTKSKN